MLKKIVICSRKKSIHLLAIVRFAMETKTAPSKLYVPFKIYNDLGDDKDSFVDLVKILYILQHSILRKYVVHRGNNISYIILIITFLFQCNCEGDSFCERSKTSVAPCQEEVIRASQPDTVVSCTSAQWICAADPECSEALDWYKRLCRPMFKGRKCTKKCQNTIETLRSLSKRQNAAKKLGKIRTQFP